MSACANTGVGPAVLKMCGGHASLNMVASYHQPDVDGLDLAIKAKHGSPSKIREDFGEHGDPMESDDDGSVIDALKDIEPYAFHPEDSKLPATSRSIPTHASAAGNLLVDNSGPSSPEDSIPAALYASLPVAAAPPLAPPLHGNVTVLSTPRVHLSPLDTAAMGPRGLETPWA